MDTSYYRMEVFIEDEGWMGYFMGLAHHHPFARDVYCGMSIPPHFDFSTECWATEEGWRKIMPDLKHAISECYKYKVPYRFLKHSSPSANPPVFQDEDQILAAAPFINKDECVIRLQEWNLT